MVESSDDDVGTNRKWIETGSESPKSKKLKLDLNNLVLDYLEQEGFAEVRDDLAAALQKQKDRKRKSPKRSKPKPTPTVAPKVPESPVSFSDFFIYSYLISNPDFSEVAADLEKVRGPFLQFDFRTEEAGSPKNRKKKRSDESPFRESQGAHAGADDPVARDRPTAAAVVLPTQDQRSLKTFHVTSLFLDGRKNSWAFAVF